MKDTLYYNGIYYQGSLKDSTCEILLDLVNNYSSVADLKHAIYNLAEHQINEIKKECENYEVEHGSLSGFVSKLSNKDYSLGTLRDEQTLGVAFMYYAGSMLLGDEVGLGKTVQIAGLANVLQGEYKNHNRKFKYLFLTEKTNVAQIRNKLIQFTGEYVGMIPSGEQKDIDKYINANTNAKYYSVVGSHSLMGNSDFLVSCAKSPFDLIIIDEGAVVKNHTVDTYTNAKALVSVHDRRIILNATPLETDLMDFYNQLALLDPHYLPPRGEFRKTYCTFIPSSFGYKPNGYKNESIFKDAIKLRYLARTRAGLGATYKDNGYRVIYVEQSEEQKRLFKKTSLYQLLNDYPPDVDMNVPFNLTTTPKVAALVDLLSKIDVKRDKALVYCKYKNCQASIEKVLNELGYNTVILNGTTKAKLRNEIISDFNNDVYDILITNVQRGIDLNECNNCIMYTIDPNPQKMVQVEGRITREFNIMYKNVYLLVAMGKEKKFVEDKLMLRVKASESFVNAGQSMTMQAIKDKENVDLFKV